MTPQEAFSTSYLGILKQGKASVGLNGKCLYFAPDGSRCAIGQLIPISQRKRCTEGEAVSALQKKILTLRGLSTEFLLHLRNCHDDASASNNFILAFKAGMQNLASDYKLLIPSLS